MRGSKEERPAAALAQQVREWAQQLLAGTDPELGLEIDAETISGSECETLLLTYGGDARALLCVWPPDLPADLNRLLTRAAGIAQRKRAPWFATFTLREACLWQTPAGGSPISAQRDNLRRYSPIHAVPEAPGAKLDALAEIEVRKLLEHVLCDIGHLHQDGHLRLVDVDSTFFVNRLEEAVRTIAPWVTKALGTKVGMDTKFKAKLAEWAVRQGIANFGDEAFFETVARQTVYRLVGKIILYQSLRRHARNLPELDLAGVDEASVMFRLSKCFEQARSIDYQAVFTDDLTETIQYPSKAIHELVRLTEDLDRYNFGTLPQEVLGEVFERLIPAEERHGLGQYFTPEDLVDLILGFCLRSKDDTVLDPTCGTGTFLLRAYNHHKTLGRANHSALLSKLWGVDIAPFPSELATINLYRQDLSRYDNFPRVLCRDFLGVMPGQSFDFPPPQATEGGPAHVRETLPQFDAAVGNFPFIRQEEIENQVPGYKRMLARTLAEQWLAVYPDLFDIPKNAQADYARLRRDGLPLDSLFDLVGLKLSGLADMYAYLFVHAAAFVRQGGRLGFITSNAWLDAGYGYYLQRFLLDNFRVIAIVESRCEPWFDKAKVNTVVTVVERCEDRQQRDDNMVHFVKVRKPLATLIPMDMRAEGLTRWTHIKRVTRAASAHPGPAYDANTTPLPTQEDDSLRVRSVLQSHLRDELEREGRTVKWGRLLRAPDVYHSLTQSATAALCPLGELARPQFGSKTRINEFFHVDQATVEKWGIAAEFLRPLLKSPGESGRIAITLDDLSLQVFVCRQSKEELRANRHLGTLRYIEWGEEQVYRSGRQQGMLWPDGPWVRKRKPGWWALPRNETRRASLFFASAYGERFAVRYCADPVIADKRLYFLAPDDDEESGILAAVLNSTITALLIETTGRVTLGDGVLELTVEEARDYLLVPDYRRFPPKARQAVLDAFQPLLTRTVASASQEARSLDRRRFDEAILKAMGLDPRKWLDDIHAGLIEMVGERMQLGAMRGAAKGRKARRDLSKITSETMAEVVPEGVERFPDDFLECEKSAEFREVQVPDEPVRRSGSGMFHLVTSDSGGFSLQCHDPAEAKYIVYAHLSGHRSIHIPVQQMALFRAVKAYEAYLRELRQQLLKVFTERTLDHKKAAQLLQRSWQELGLPPIED